jgi:protein-disulfide isomerase
MSTARSNSRLFLWLSATSAFISILIHAYLTRQHYDLEMGLGEKSMCDLSATFNCTAVTASRYSELLGVPLAMFGAVANLAFLILLAWWPLAESEQKRTVRRNLVLVAGVLIAASIVMGSISFFAMSQFCIFCISTYVLSFVLFFSLLKGLSTGDAEPIGRDLIALGLKGVAPLLVIAAVGFLGSFIANDQIRSSYGLDRLDTMARDAVQEWQSNPARKFELAGALTKGASADRARLTISEFADFRCIHCKHAKPTLEAFVASHPDVRLQFQTWPLDGECNSRISQTNGASCELARASWCAEKTNGSGWKVHEYIYDHDLLANKDAVDALLPKLAEVTSIAAGEFKACVDSEEARAMVRKQSDIGNQLNIEGTPTIYANGKLLPDGQLLKVLQKAYSTLSAK